MAALISVVIPALNEQENIAPLEKELLEAVEGLSHQFEFIVIDNGSIDETPSLVRRLCEIDARWRYVRFSRNFGVEASMTAGYRIARGEAIIVLYSDLQDPPALIPDMLRKWEDGFDVVYGVRTVRRGDPRWRNAMVALAYRVIDGMAEVRIPRNAGDFRLVSARVRDALLECEERNRYTRGLIAWLGFRQTGVVYERRGRRAGRSKAPVAALLVFVLSAITSFSLRPLRLFTWLGFILVVLSLLAVPIYLVLFLVGNPPPGITTLIVLGLLGIGINSLGIGVLGEYLGRTYAETKRRPLYVIEELVNVQGPNSEGRSRAVEEFPSDPHDVVG